MVKKFKTSIGFKSGKEIIVWLNNLKSTSSADNALKSLTWEDAAPSILYIRLEDISYIIYEEQ